MTLKCVVCYKWPYFVLCKMYLSLQTDLCDLFLEITGGEMEI